MRPIRRGGSPQAHDFDPYTDAKTYLVSRLGHYCSYCERRVPTGLAVEHLQPKALAAYAHLIGTWSNFLLACVNCNSVKSKKPVAFSDLLFPDRDNTCVAFQYLADGQISPAPGLPPAVHAAALATLDLTALNKKVADAIDENGEIVAFDRASQRIEAWLIADDALADWVANPCNEVKRCIVRSALGHGYFSVWLTVFANEPEICQALVDGFPGTQASGCFAPPNAQLVTPHPNADALAFGGKI